MQSLAAQCVTRKYYGTGEFYFPPPKFYMSTAIAIAWSEYGFGIAADGRHCDASTHVVISDNVQKIFPVTVNGKPLAYVLAGIIQISDISDSGEAKLSFDFSEAVPHALIAPIEARSLWHFADIVGKRILESLKSALDTLRNRHPSITHVLITGYYRGPECVIIKFNVPESPDVPEYEVNRCELVADGFIPCGSKIILDRLSGYDGDALIEKYRPAASSGLRDIRRSVDIARNVVLAHLDPAIRALDPKECEPIGGHVHMAQIRQDGFSWIIPPKPVETQ